MIIPTSSSLSIDSKNNKNIDNFNTLKIDFAKMSFIEGNFNSYTQCIKCKGILTVEDKTPQFLSHIAEHSKWHCRFCDNKNQIIGQISFCSSPYKYILEKNIACKIAPPIILFLIDYSGSMGESIINVNTTQNKLKDKNLFPKIKENIKLYQLLKNSKIYSKERQKFQKLRLEWDQDKDDKDQDQIISKHCLGMLKEKKGILNFRVGFIFFNTHIYFLKGSKQKFIPTFIHKGSKVQETWPLQMEQIDFNNYHQLFGKGKKFDKYFGDSRINTLDTQKINLSSIQIGGKTAFGPALALALGIVSEHDSGSRIIAITDSQSNFGILSNEENGLIYKQISKALKQSKTVLSILKWKKNQNISYQDQKNQQQFYKYSQSQSQHIQIIQMNLQKCNQIQKIQKSMKFLTNLIKRSAIGNTQQIYLLSDTSAIKFDKFQYDKLDYRTLRFINSGSKNWIQIKINKKQLKQINYVFPVVNQIVVIYNDIFRKEKVLFMSYVTQKIIKDNQIQQKQIQYLDHLNPNNLQTLFDLENINKYSKFQQLDQDKRTYRKEIKKLLKINQFQIDISECQTLNGLADLKDRIRNQQQQLQYL